MSQKYLFLRLKSMLQLLLFVPLFALFGVGVNGFSLAPHRNTPYLKNATLSKHEARVLNVSPAQFVSTTPAIALSAGDSERRGEGGPPSAGSDDRFGLRAWMAPLLDAVEDSTANSGLDEDIEIMLQRFLDLVPQQLQPCTLNVTLNRLDAFWKAWGLRGERGGAVVKKIVGALFQLAIEVFVS